jgi:ABC-type multidrug transport system fused ATPase/permease subunit
MINILRDETLKLKTKVILFSGTSLFVGLTKVLPTKLALIGLNFKDNGKTMGWFLLTITLILFLNFIILGILDIIKYYQNYLLGKKEEQFTGDTLGLTYKEIHQEDYKQEFYNNKNENIGSFQNEIDNLNKKTKILRNNFDKKLFFIYNLIELIFNIGIPIILACFGLIYLYHFLICM